MLVLTILSCSNSNNLKGLDGWLGEYSYEEEPVKAIAGYSMAMDWKLSINKDGDTCQGILEVNGQQTYIKLLTTVTGDTSSITITYNSLIDGTGENLRRGDTLFMLSRHADILKTKWVALGPRLLKSPNKECDCFILDKKQVR